MLFDNIPDDYKMQKVLTGDKFADWSYVGIMKHLRTIEVSDEFSNNKFYATEVLSHMAMDYLKSAQYLYSGIVGDRDGNIVSHYLVPCAFACKHSIELKLKECQIEKGFEKLKGHSVLEVWNALDEIDIPHSKEITAFLGEVETSPVFPVILVRLCCLSFFLFDLFYHTYRIGCMYPKENPKYFRFPVSSFYPGQ